MSTAFQRDERVRYSTAHLKCLGYWPHDPRGWARVQAVDGDLITVQWEADGYKQTARAGCFVRSGQADDRWIGHCDQLGWKDWWPKPPTYSPAEGRQLAKDKLARERRSWQVAFRKKKGEKTYYGRVNGECCYITWVRRACWSIFWKMERWQPARSCGAALAHMNGLRYGPVGSAPSDVGR